MWYFIIEREKNKNKERHQKDGVFLCIPEVWSAPCTECVFFDTSLYAKNPSARCKACVFIKSCISDEDDNLLNNESWFVLSDAAGYVATSYLDLKKYPADFICLSFYKMFGFPTGKSTV